MKSSGRNEDGVSIPGVRAVGGTEKALRCRLRDDGEREVWVPRSQITDDSEVYDVGDEGELVVTSWFADRERRDGLTRAIEAIEALDSQAPVARRAAVAPTPKGAPPRTRRTAKATVPAVASNGHAKANSTANGTGRAPRGELAPLVLRALSDLGTGSTAQVAAAVQALGYETAAKRECWVQMVYQVLAKHPRVTWHGRGKGWSVKDGAA